MSLVFYSDDEILQVCKSGWWNKRRLAFHGFPGLLAFDLVGNTPERELKSRLPKSGPSILRVSRKQRIDEPNNVMFHHIILEFIDVDRIGLDAKKELQSWILCDQCHRYSRLKAFDILCVKNICSDSELSFIVSSVGGDIRKEIYKMQKIKETSSP